MTALTPVLQQFVQWANLLAGGYVAPPADYSGGFV
jgi:hypothetical protein